MADQKVNWGKQFKDFFIPKEFSMDGLMGTGLQQAATMANMVVNPGVAAGLLALDAGSQTKPGKEIQQMLDATGPLGGGLDDIILASVPIVAKNVTKVGKAAAAAAKEVRATTKAMGDAKAAILNIREMSPDAARQAVIAGKHLKRDKSGQYIGAPRGIDTPKKLADWRESRYQEFLQAYQEVPESSQWYRRALDGTREQAGPDPHAQYRQAREHAVNSSQANLDTNSAFTYKAQHDYQKGLRENNIVRTGQQYDSFVEGRRTGKTPLGLKTEPYSTKFDPTLNTHDFDEATGKMVEGAAGNGKSKRSTVAGGNVNDTHHKGWLYGEDAPDTFTPQEHAFSDAETMLFAERASREKLGGKSDWTVGEVQATRWVVQKAEQLLKQGKVKSLEDGYREALKTYSDYDHKYRAFHTDETVPGRRSNHHPSLLEAPPEIKEAYHADVMRNFGNPHGDGRYRDQIYDDAKISQLPQKIGQGRFVDDEGYVAENPTLLTTPLVHHQPDAPTQFVKWEKRPDGTEVSKILDDTDVGIGDSARNNMQAHAEDWAYNFVQDGGAGSKPIWNAKDRNKGGIYFPTQGRLTPDQIAQLNAVTAPHGLPDVLDYHGGVAINRFYPPEVDKRQVDAALADVKAKLSGIVAGAGNPEKVRIDGVYANYADAFHHSNEGKGIATQQYLDAMKRIPGAYDIRNNNPRRAAALGWLADASDNLTPVAGPPRADVQNSRRIRAANPTTQLDALGTALDKMKAIRERAAQLGWSEDETNAAVKKAGVWLPALGLLSVGLTQGRSEEQRPQVRTGLLAGSY